MQRKLIRILAMDVVGCSRLMERDEAGTLGRLREIRKEVINPSIARHSGSTVKTMGDGALIEFGSAVDALTCAAEIQTAIARRNEADGAGLSFRAGLHVGDVIVEGGGAIRFGGYEIDEALHELRRNGYRVPMEPRAFDLLALLARNVGRIVTKDEIFAEIWNDRIVSNAALSSQIKAARKAVGDTGADQAVIATAHGRGFRFIALVTLPLVEAPASEAAPAAAAPAAV